MAGLALCAWAALGVTPMQAQQQEQNRTFMQRIDNPDMNLEFVPRASGGSLVKEFKVPSARVKPFVFRQKFREKEFRTQEFRSKAYTTADFSQGGRTYTTGNALDGWRSNADPNRIAKAALGIKNFAAGDARERGKTAAKSDTQFATRKAEMRGASQEELNRQYTEPPALSIDQVRELLNKNK